MAQPATVNSEVRLRQPRYSVPPGLCEAGRKGTGREWVGVACEVYLNRVVCAAVCTANRTEVIAEVYLLSITRLLPQAQAEFPVHRSSKGSLIVPAPEYRYQTRFDMRNKLNGTECATVN